MDELEKARITLNFLTNNPIFDISVDSIVRLKAYIRRNEYVNRVIDSLSEQVKESIEQVYPNVDLSILEHSEYIGFYKLPNTNVHLYYFKKLFEINNLNYDVYISIVVNEDLINSKTKPNALIYVYDQNKNIVEDIPDSLNNYLLQGNMSLKYKIAPSNEDNLYKSLGLSLDTIKVR